MKKTIFILLFALTYLSVGYCDKILFITMPQSRSHIFSMLPLAHKLREHDHQISVYFSIIRPELPFGEGIKDETIVMKDLPPHLLGMFESREPEIEIFIWKNDFLPYMFPEFWSVTTECTNHLLGHQKYDFYKIANQTWDLLVIDPLFASCGISMAKATKAPYIHFSTAMIDPVYTYYKGLARSFAAAPITAPVSRHDTPFWNPNSFMDRFRVFYDSVFYLLVHWIAVEKPVLTEVLKLVDGSQFKFSQMYGDDLLTVYEYFDKLDFPMPTSNQFVSSGASCSGTPQPLPPEFESFVNAKNSSGTILMAFGTVIRWNIAPEPVRKAWVEVLSELKEFRIIWGMQYVEDAKKVIGPVPDHIMVTGWLPQKDILSHKSTKLFISHGGLKSVKEVICAEVPALYMPIFAEQQRNAFLAKTLGFGEYVNKRKVNAGEVLKTIRKMTSSTSYYEKVKKTKSVWLDRVIPALDEVAFKVNQVLKYKGVPRKYSSIKFEASWIRFLFIDISIFPLLVIVFISN